MIRALAACGLGLALLAGIAPSEVRTRPGRPQFSTMFSREEFAGRRARIAAAIGPRAVALVHGAPSVHSSAIFRQSNEFFYVTGVTVPQAYLLIDGGSRRSTLYLPPRDERRATTEGGLLTAHDRAEGSTLTGLSAG